MQFQNPSKTIFYQIERAIKQYRTMAQRNLNELNIKVTINQILLMIQISDKPDISQVDLSKLLFKDVASIARMIEILVQKKFIEREENSSDRRKKHLKITNKGKKLLNVAIPIISKNRETAQKDISEEEIKTLFRILNKINKNTSK